MGKIMRNGVQYGVDTADVLSTVAECDASASGGKGTTQVASAKALSELNSNLGGIRFGVDENGNYGYKKAGADTVTPFKTVYKLGTFSSETAQNLNISQYNVESVDDVIVEIVSYGSVGANTVLNNIPTAPFYTAYIKINIGMPTKSIKDGILTIPAFACKPQYSTLTYGNTNLQLGISTSYATYNVYIISK